MHIVFCTSIINLLHQLYLTIRNNYLFLSSLAFNTNPGDYYNDLVMFIQLVERISPIKYNINT